MANADINELQRNALVFMEKGNFKKALKTIKLAIKLNKTLAINYYIQGRLFQEMMDFESSILAFKKYFSLERNNENSDTFRKAKFHLSICYLTVRNFRKGLELYHFRHEEIILNKYSAKKNIIFK